MLRNLLVQYFLEDGVTVVFHLCGHVGALILHRLIYSFALCKKPYLYGQNSRHESFKARIREADKEVTGDTLQQVLQEVDICRVIRMERMWKLTMFRNI
jgi:hypothetical protein